jgi:hypothetical protein
VPATTVTMPTDRQARKRPVPTVDDDAEDDSSQGDSIDEDYCWHRHVKAKPKVERAASAVSSVRPRPLGYETCVARVRGHGHVRLGLVHNRVHVL